MQNDSPSDWLARRLRASQNPLARPSQRETAMRPMRRQMLRTAVLRISALTLLLSGFACCGGPTETVEGASEAMVPLPPCEPSPRFTVAPRPTAEELAEIEQLVRDNLPKWHVYANGFDYDIGTAPSADGGRRYYRHPQEIDRHCALVLIPEGGNDRPETWIFLRYEHYWMKGAAYFTDELKLSVFDVLGILLALDEAGGHVPPLSSLLNRAESDACRDSENGPYGPALPDWGIDNHTCIGGPPSHWRQPPAPTPQPSSPTRPPRSDGGGNWGVTPPRRHTGPPSESFDGVKPRDQPVGKYPGWNKPHPGEWWQRFRCGGQVWEGYKSDCPDFQEKPLGERWTKPFDELARDLADNARYTLELIRTDPNCTFMCKLIGAMPALLHMVCIEVPAVHPVMRVICAVFGSLKVTVGASIAGLKVDDSCEKWCQKPPQGASGRQP